MHRAGYQIRFRPSAHVLAEVPSTLGSLWKQRLRWTRGLAQTALMHRDMVGNRRYGRLGLYLPFNLSTMLLTPVLQLLALPLVIANTFSGNAPFNLSTLGLFIWSALAAALVSIIFATILDRAWRDLRHLPRCSCGSISHYD